MKIFKSSKSIQKHIQQKKTQKKSVGFVPTMGALHEGHLSLIRKSRRENDITVVSVFVNPLQFGPREDFSSYPRQWKKDKFLLQKENTDIIFFPTAEEMYPDVFKTSVGVADLGRHLCGAKRPGHFNGVTTVVCKLLNIVLPDRLYVGQKDAQQAIILKRMVADLNLPVIVQICPTVREKDGLALSSRNKYLNSKQRQEAPVLYQTLRTARKKIAQGERQASKIIKSMKTNIQKTSGKIDYIACVDLETLTPLKRIDNTTLIALAVKFGRARLIDNVIVSIS